MSSIYERIEKLKLETADLRKEVKDLKETMLQQNELIITLLSKQNGMLDETIEDRSIPQVLFGKKCSEFSRRFPLESMEDLEQFENDINEENKPQIIPIIQSLLSPQGLMKNCVNILSENIIMQSNLDGHQNKKRLLNYPKTIDILFHACKKDDNFTTKAFLNDFRRGLRAVKNRKHKKICIARKKLRNDQAVENFLVSMDEQAEPSFIGTTGEESEQSFIVKTEEIFFD